MKKREPNFEENLLPVLRGERPQRATLFEFIIDGGILDRATGERARGETETEQLRHAVEAHAALGYDHCSTQGATWGIHPYISEGADTISLNARSYISDWESFEKYPWPDMNSLDYSRLEKIKPYLPDGMKLMVYGPDGVLENTIGLIGYDNLCMMLYDEPELVKAVADQVGERMLQYFTTALQYDSVGFICSNDDWGFNTQTLLSPKALRQYIFPWHKRIVDAARAQGKPCILHSCGYFNEIIDDVIDSIGFDARHSYEDNIVPVEEAYEHLNGRIAVLGGMDVGFLCTRTPEEICKRCRAMLERTQERGGYALGSGNSIPAYVPMENYMAMLRAAWEFDR